MADQEGGPEERVVAASVLADDLPDVADRGRQSEPRALPALGDRSPVGDEVAVDAELAAVGQGVLEGHSADVGAVGDQQLALGRCPGGVEGGLDRQQDARLARLVAAMEDVDAWLEAHLDRLPVRAEAVHHKPRELHGSSPSSDWRPIARARSASCRSGSSTAASMRDRSRRSKAPRIVFDATGASGIVRVRSRSWRMK